MDAATPEKGALRERPLRAAPARDAELRARVINAAVSDAIRVGVGAWVQAGQRGPVEKYCQRSLTMLRAALAETPS